MGIFVYVHVWKSQGNLEESVLSSYLNGSQGVKLKCAGLGGTFAC